MPAQASTPPKLRITGLSKSFQKDSGTVHVLDGIDLSVDPGQFVSVIGPSGCGKSTLFNILAGLMPHDRGDIALDGQAVPHLRGKVGYMLQRDLLMPWRSVIDNVVVGLEVRGHPRRQSLEQARHYLSLIHI